MVIIGVVSPNLAGILMAYRPPVEQENAIFRGMPVGGVERTVGVIGDDWPGKAIMELG
ncbi:MAG: hypothetical protein M1358_12475 [Chloroflexi bacterium]|nr:hypothetical protein [Chloroflexota bacterium]